MYGVGEIIKVGDERVITIYRSFRISIVLIQYECVCVCVEYRSSSTRLFGKYIFTSK